CRNNGASTFKKIRSVATTEALSEKEVVLFLKALNSINHRDYLIAKTILQGAKRLDEVLTAKISQIDWEGKKITFRQSKSRELEQVTVIHYPENFMEELREYIGDRDKEEWIFITTKGNRVVQPHIFRSFVNAGKIGGISKKVTAHTLRATAITVLTNKGYNVEQIMKVSGHATPNCVSYYDKTPIEKNITEEVALI
ncbi:site-specific integrase, partial [Candidatus Woesearchaeota archaeon]|nr:site-specific integrase [Candidatus Woesearchaeota archaeon]